MLKKTTIQYLLGIGLALLIIPIAEGTLALLPDIGWHFMAIIYVIIFILQITFYYLTTNFKFGWTVLSFVLNFILWTFEQVIIENNFQNSFLYQLENWRICIYTLGGLLWVTNKILIDQIFNFNKSIHRHTSKIKV